MTDKEMLENLLYSDFMDMVVAKKLKENIELFIHDYERLRKISLNREMTDVEFSDKADLQADILAMERVYVMYSGDWEYKSYITGAKIYA